MTAVNDTPTATAQSVSGNEDASQTIILSGSDADGDALTYVIATQPSNNLPGRTFMPDIDWATLSGSSVTYTPSSNFNGSDSFTFTVSDASATSPAATVSIDVLAVNGPPTLSAIGARGIQQGGVLVIELAGVDPDQDAITYSASGIPTGASLVNGTFTWTPTSEQIGVHAVTFTAADSNGGTDSEVVTITVAAVASPAIIVFPVSLNFGSVTLGQSKSLSLVVSNEGGGTLRVLNIVGSRAAIVVSESGFTLDAGKEKILTVSLQPAVIGSFSETLDIPSNDPNRPLVQVSMRAIVGTGGGQASFATDVSMVNFGAVAVNGYLAAAPTPRVIPGAELMRVLYP